jgi:hypothetical protein
MSIPLNRVFGKTPEPAAFMGGLTNRDMLSASGSCARPSQ